MSKNEVNSISLKEILQTIDAEVAEFRKLNLIEGVKKSSALNNPAVTSLKYTIERMQASIDTAKDAVSTAHKAYEAAKATERQLESDHAKALNTLYLVSSGLGVTSSEIQEMMHELNADCDHDDCSVCCGEFAGHEFDSSEGGHCINCGFHEHE